MSLFLAHLYSPVSLTRKGQAAVLRESSRRSALRFSLKNDICLDIFIPLTAYEPVFLHDLRALLQKLLVL